MMGRLMPFRMAVAAGLLCLAAPAMWAQKLPRAGSPERADDSQSAQFLAENAAVMDRMMHAMDATPTGDVDRDFVAMMVPHHQGAIDMAKIVLRYGRNEQVRRLAQEIIVTQQQEIAAMRLAVGEPLPTAPTESPPVGAQAHRAH